MADWLEELDRDLLAQMCSTIMERGRLEKLYLRATPGARHPGRLTRRQLAERVLPIVRQRPKVAEAFATMLDRITRSERAWLAAADATQLRERFDDARLPDLGRAGWRWLWALVRSENEDVSDAKKRLITALSRPQQTDEKKTSVNEPVLETMLKRELSESEKERARLLAELAVREQTLRAERAKSADLTSKLRSVERIEPVAVPPPAAPPQADTGGRWKRKFEVAEERRSALAAEIQTLKEEQELLSRLKEDNRRLRDALCAQRTERPQPSSRGGGVLTESPKRRRGKVISKDPSARVGVFLDVANLSGAARRLFAKAIDFGRLRDVAAEDRTVVQCRAYAIRKDPAAFTAFAAQLKSVGYQVFGKEPQQFSDGSVKADWDLGIAMDVVAQHSGMDVLVLGTGDGDFVPLVKYLQGQGVRVEVMGFPERSANELRRVADACLDLGPDVLLD